LFAVSPETFRYAASILSLAMLGLLMTGLRYQGQLTPPLIFGTGGLAGLCGGAAGIPGPPVILFYLASPHSPVVVRANTFLYLLGYNLMLLAFLLIAGQLVLVPVMLGLLLTIPNAMGNFCGAALFQPRYERGYRVLAYVLIAGAAVARLPLWEL